jgi:hypothetical protein
MPSTASPARSASRIRSTASPGEAPSFEDNSTIAPVLETRSLSALPLAPAGWEQSRERFAQPTQVSELGALSSPPHPFPSCSLQVYEVDPLVCPACLN